MVRWLSAILIILLPILAFAGEQESKKLVQMDDKQNKKPLAAWEREVIENLDLLQNLELLQKMDVVRDLSILKNGGSKS